MLGQPGSGKTSTRAVILRDRPASAVLDLDEVRASLMRMASAPHSEYELWNRTASRYLDAMRDYIWSRRANFLSDQSGRNPDPVLRQIGQTVKYGYRTTVSLVAVPLVLSAFRCVRRYLEQVRMGAVPRLPDMALQHDSFRGLTETVQRFSTLSERPSEFVLWDGTLSRFASTVDPGEAAELWARMSRYPDPAFLSLLSDPSSDLSERAADMYLSGEVPSLRMREMVRIFDYMEKRGVAINHSFRYHSAVAALDRTREIFDLDGSQRLRTPRPSTDYIPLAKEMELRAAERSEVARTLSGFVAERSGEPPDEDRVQSIPQTERDR